MMSKYRAWHISKQIMCEVIRIDFEQEIVTLDLETDDDEYFWVETDWSFSDVEIMQSTGVKDADGVEIYEGDIVTRTYLFNGGLGETHTGEIVYDKEYARYVISKPKEYIEPETEDLGNILSNKSTYRVIGNCYENLELLEEMK